MISLNRPLEGAATLASDVLPEGRIKSALREQWRKRRIRSLIGDVPIVDSGIVDGDPYIDLENGLRFYGIESDEHERMKHEYLSESTKERLIPEAYFVARDCHRSYIDLDFDRERHYTISEGDTVVEVGAYIGFYTAYLSETVGDGGRVLSIEAHPDNYELLSRNVSQNGLENVTPVHSAISDRNETVTFYESDEVSGKDNSLREDNFEEHDVDISPLTVESRTLDTILDECGVQNVDYAIITVNKAELDVLNGMTNTLEGGLHLSCVAAVDRQEILTLLNEHGYETTVSDEFFAPIVYGWM